MRLFLQVLRWSGIGVAGLFGLVVLAYGVLVVINWTDEPPSETYLAYEAMLDRLLPPEHPDNAYTYFAGIDAPGDSDPLTLGREWLQWSRLPVREQVGADGPQGINTRAPFEHESEQQAFWEACIVAAECPVFLESGGDSVYPELTEARWMVDRYQKLLSYPVWHEPAAQSALGIPSYSGVIRFSRLYGYHAWQLARDGDYEIALGMLDREAGFWRKALETSSTMISRVIISSILQHNLKWSNVVQQIGVQAGHAGIPQSWQTQISASERSMQQAIAGELSFTEHLLVGGFGLNFYQEYELGLGRFVMDEIILKPLLQKQASLNLLANVVRRTERMLRQPYARIPGAMQEVRAKNRRLAEDLLFSVVNPAGKYDLVLMVSHGGYIYSGLRTADLEGMRRVLVLAARLRSEGVAREAVPARLQTAELRNPYTDEPFGWDAGAATIIFEDLASGERSEFRLKY